MSKNIIVCYDGTGNEYGANNTNVVGIFEKILRDDNQVAFYDPGVGTFDPLGKTIGKKMGMVLSKAFGYGLRQNIEDGYEYLMNNYKPEDPENPDANDKLFIFGFSRGAYTARALAGMINRFGILQQGSKNLIPYVSKYYLNRELGREKEQQFKRTYCHPCKPHFIGVWDTVGSLGHINGRKFKDNILNKDVKYGYQAIAIDEQRKKFPVSLWNESEIGEDQYIEQVWFSGVHSDVGGWYKERELSDIALGWMLDRAEKHGLRVEEGWQKSLSQDPTTTGDVKIGMDPWRWKTWIGKDTYATGLLHQSRNGFWKLWSPVKREIPAGANIHRSVLDRMDKVEAYNPTLPQDFYVTSNPTYKEEKKTSLETQIKGNLTEV